MSNSTFARADTRRPLFALRRKPGRLAVAVFRLPLKAYQHNAGPAVGRTFVMFTHVGRKTGQPHQTVAMVLRDNTATGEAVICAGWGPHTDWYRNLQAHPAVKVQLGGQTLHPAAAPPHREGGVRRRHAVPARAPAPAAVVQHRPRLG